MSPSCAPDYAPPPGPPSTTRPIHIPTPQAPMTEEPPLDAPPPYTARASDPLPSWSARCAQLVDYTDSEDISELARLPLDPPPTCFSSPTPLRIRSHSFDPPPVNCNDWFYGVDLPMDAPRLDARRAPRGPSSAVVRASSARYDARTTALPRRQAITSPAVSRRFAPFERVYVRITCD